MPDEGKAPSGEDTPRLKDACGRCGAYCCTYYTLPIEKPETLEDFDDIRWFLMHEGNYVFVEDGEWYLNVNGRCKNLVRDGGCMAYDKRPKICRRHGKSEEPCEFFSDYEFEEQFFTPQEIEWYAARKLGLKREETKGWYVFEDEGFWKAVG